MYVDEPRTSKLDQWMDHSMGGSFDITSDNNSLLFECWQTKDSWGGLMTGLFNVRETDITSNDISMLFEWQSLRLNPRLTRGVVRLLPWLFPVPLLWRLLRPFLERGMKNKIWVCGDIVCLIFYLSTTIIRWEPIFLRKYWSPLSIQVPGIKIDHKLLVSKSSQSGSKIYPLWKRPLI